MFGQPDTEGDDATARVYVHRLRKRLEEFYAAEGDGPGGARLVLPAGTYALRFAGGSRAGRRLDASPGQALAFRRGLRGRAGARAPRRPPAPAGAMRRRPTPSGSRSSSPTARSSSWSAMYYMFGEIDPVRPEQSRLIRDFRIDSPTDLAALQEAEPERYGNAEDVGLTYLPLSTAEALRHVMPILARDGRDRARHRLVRT